VLSETIHVFGLDPALCMLQRTVHLDLDDLDGAIAELDRLHGQAEEH
jgi:hypothetical protein